MAAAATGGVPDQQGKLPFVAPRSIMGHACAMQMWSNAWVGDAMRMRQSAADAWAQHGRMGAAPSAHVAPDIAVIAVCPLARPHTSSPWLCKGW